MSMSSADLQTPYRDGNPKRPGIVCAHCGYNQEDTVNERIAYISCGCPGHLKSLLVGFEEMRQFPDRVELFERHLEAEPCANMWTADNGKEYSACMVLSVMGQMCPACRLKLTFFHTIYNWESYHPAAPGMGGSFTE